MTIISYNKGSRKICAYIVVKCANCGGGHYTNSNWCTSRLKVEANAYKKKKLDKNKAKKVETNKSNDKVYNKADSSPNMGMSLELKSWAVNEKKAALIRMKFLNR